MTALSFRRPQHEDGPGSNRRTQADPRRGRPGCRGERNHRQPGPARRNPCRACHAGARAGGRAHTQLHAQPAGRNTRGRTIAAGGSGPSVTVQQRVFRCAERARDPAGAGGPSSDPRRVADLLSWRPAGLVLAPAVSTAETRRLLAASGVPVVEIMDADPDPIDVVVGLSQRATGRAMAHYLLGRGYRRLAYVGHDISTDPRALSPLQGLREG